MYSYILEEEPTGNAQEVSFDQFLEKFLRPQSEDFSSLLDKSASEYTISEYIKMSDTSKKVLA